MVKIQGNKVSSDRAGKVCFTHDDMKLRELCDVQHVALMSGDIITVIILLIIPGSWSISSLLQQCGKGQRKKIYVLLQMEAAKEK